MKYKIRKRKKTFMTWHIVLALILMLILISTSYSLWSSELYINGTVTGKYTEPELPVEIPSQGTDSNGVNRFTGGGKVNFLGQKFYIITKEEYQDNIITTTFQQNYIQSWWQNTATLSITLTIPNNSDTNFTDGKIEIVDSSDSNGIFNGDISYNVSSTTINPGETATVTIRGNLKGYVTLNNNNTHYNFVISYKVGEVKCYFYYNMIFLPK